ncbi:unnamed protein product [Lepeophtheirus salmonis]|uniref:(salmon louse) hypothetical protein n=1 Tax=Lepeophtheirus salmonis TaxID=72036 RepID=A0A7R8D403_LEPSM|nr:uncharacterized protein LOC121120981 [Lepeophtheirus salmonis]CAB4067519.1 unnamed protein product [Lepeophtheirus salmonis]CAF2989304.1 unnamed protein product [Lepeophtheirus salmonis]
MCNPLQLHHERTEERRKLQQTKQSGNKKNPDVQDRWKKLLEGNFSSMSGKTKRRISGLSEKTVNQELPSIIYDDEPIIESMQVTDERDPGLKDEEEVPIIHISSDQDHEIIEILGEEDEEKFEKTVLI